MSYPNWGTYPGKPGANVYTFGAVILTLDWDAPLPSDVPMYVEAIFQRYKAGETIVRNVHPDVAQGFVMFCQIGRMSPRDLQIIEIKGGHA